MAFAEILLFSTDRQMAEGVGRTVRLISGCTLSHLTTLASDAEAELSRHPVVLVIVHVAGAISESCAKRILKMSASDGQAGVPVLVILDEPSAAIENWINLGAADCLCRPLDFGQLGLLVNSLTLRVREGPGTQPARWLKVDGLAPYCFQSDRMLSLAERVEKLRDRDCNILITGETGTGKTHLAAIVHGLSKRAEHPFLAVNCAAIPAELVESELFGHRRGAFAGAICDQPGQLRAAGSGSLLLDEIDALPLAIQTKLLHVVEGRTYIPVGGNREMSFQGRLMAASNQSLDMLVDQRRFRADLFYRLNVVELEVPPLRARLCEIPTLVTSYLARSLQRYGRPAQFLSVEAIEELRQHSWPGNVRELYNVLERVMAYCDEPEIGVRQLRDAWGRRHVTSGGDESPDCPDVNATHAAALSNPALLRNVVTYPAPACSDSPSSERVQLIDLLRRHSQNRSVVARELGISRTALYKKLGKHGLTKRSLN